MITPRPVLVTELVIVSVSSGDLNVGVQPGELDVIRSRRSASHFEETTDTDHA